MSDKLTNKKIAFLATNGFEQVELTKPWEAIKDAGATVELVSIKSGKIQGVNHDENADAFEADVVRGRVMTSWPSLRTDLTNAGAIRVDEERVCDEGLVTSRNPDDLPAFCAKAIEEFAEGKHAGQTA